MCTIDKLYAIRWIMSSIVVLETILTPYSVLRCEKSEFEMDRGRGKCQKHSNNTHKSLVTRLDLSMALMIRVLQQTVCNLFFALF